MIIKLFWKYFKEDFTKLYIKEIQNKPITHAQLEYVMTDLNLMKYYRFNNNNMMISFERAGYRETFIKHLLAAVDEVEINTILDAADQLITEGLSTGKNAAKIGALHWQIRERFKKCIPSELFYNIIAVELVREDEQPNVYDNKKQLEKVAALKELNKENPSFFFQLPELVNLLKTLNLSNEEFLKALEESANRSEILAESLKIILSKT